MSSVHGHWLCSGAVVLLESAMSLEDGSIASSGHKGSVPVGFLSFPALLVGEREGPHLSCHLINPFSRLFGFLKWPSWPRTEHKFEDCSDGVINA